MPGTLRVTPSVSGPKTLCGGCGPITQNTVMIPGRCRLVPRGVSVTLILTAPVRLVVEEPCRRPGPGGQDVPAAVGVDELARGVDGVRIDRKLAFTGDRNLVAVRGHAEVRSLHHEQIRMCRAVCHCDGRYEHDCRSKCQRKQDQTPHKALPWSRDVTGRSLCPLDRPDNGSIECRSGPDVAISPHRSP